MADFYGHQTPHGSFVFGGHTGMEPYFGTLCHGEKQPVTGHFRSDSSPRIDTCKEVEGLAIAYGFTGHGFGIGPITGLLLSELLLDGKTSTLPIDAFRYDRF